jgi:trans-aconitate 2-methyltransferase
VTSWDPGLYNRFKAYRERPALDLMVQIPSDRPFSRIVDLGCGTGEQAAVLSARHPGARVTGLDSSPQMLDQAKARDVDVDWVLGDIADYAPKAAPDLIFTNAALQWLPDHAHLLPRLVRMLPEGGVFACQMPLSHSEPWHVALRKVAADGPWAERLMGARGLTPLLSPEDYYRLLAPLAEVDVWSTTYVHVLEGDDPIVDWMRGTGLRPYLDLLPEQELRTAFLAAYRRQLAPLFPVEPDGVTLFAFPRLFILAQRL